MDNLIDLGQIQKHIKEIDFHLNEIKSIFNHEEEQEIIHLPYDNEKELTSVYGSPGTESSLTWVNFPDATIRFYSRDGALLPDHDRDFLNRPDHRCHVAVAPSFEKAMQEIYNMIGRDRFIKEGWHIFAGFTRDVKVGKKKGGSGLSTHCWSIAVDLNPDENPFSKTGTSNKRTFSDEGIDIMEKHGWLSGGRAWSNDWMHFQRAIPYIEPGSYYGNKGLPEHIKPL